MKKLLSIILGLGGLVAVILGGWLLYQTSKASKKIESSINQFIAQELVFLDFAPFVCDGFVEVVCKSESVRYNPIITSLNLSQTPATPNTIAQNIQITLSGNTKKAKVGLSAHLSELNLPTSCDIEISLATKEVYLPSGEDLLIYNKGQQKPMRLLSTQLQCKNHNDEYLQKSNIAFDITHNDFANKDLQEIFSLLKNPQFLQEMYFRLNHIDIDMHSNTLKEYVARILFNSTQNSDIERTIFALNFMRDSLLGEIKAADNDNIEAFSRNLAKTLLLFRDILEGKVNNARFSLQAKSDTTPLVQLDKWSLALVVVGNYSLSANSEDNEEDSQAQHLESPSQPTNPTPQP